MAAQSQDKSPSTTYLQAIVIVKSLIEFDSIWRLLSGQESDAYMEDPQYAAIFKLNTIAHYDPVILEILDAPYGSVFFKDAEGHFLVDEA